MTDASACFKSSLAAAPADARIALDGPQGQVRADSGEPLEGIMVQLRGTQSNITTTVYTDENGRYEFPKLMSCHRRKVQWANMPCKLFWKMVPVSWHPTKVVVWMEFRL